MGDFCIMDTKFFKLLFFSLLLLYSIKLKAQATSAGTVSGKLIDGTNGQPLSFATVILVRKSDNHAIRSIQTDLDGKFALTPIPNGTYIFHATFVGYSTITRDSINITAAKQNYNLGSITLNKGKSLLKEVVITAQRSPIQIGIDKKSFNVDQSLVSQGGSATDLLTNVPSVQVDVDGNISLRGSTSVRVLINGKPSALTGGDISDILQSIPASSIETIEVITNPSSKYEAEGQAGIINIVLKKNTQKGFMGTASAGVGTQNTLNGTASLAYQNGKVNVYSNYSYRKGTRIGNGFIDKTTDEADGIVQTDDQTANQSFTYKGQNIRSGIDITLNPNSELSFSNNINLRSRDRTQIGQTFIMSGDSLLQRIDQNNFSTGTGTNLDFSTDFDHKFKKKGEELTANATYSIDKNNNFDNLNSDYYYYTIPEYFPSVQHNTTIGREHILNLQADYTLPLKNGKLEAGYKTLIDNSNNNYMVDTMSTVDGVFNSDPFLSNQFKYDENVNAIYTNYQHQFGKFGLQAGLRLEDTHIRTTLTDSTVTNNRQDYLRLYPSLFLTEKLGGNQTLQFSYSRRTARPNSRQLSPFVDESNRLSYSEGNPYLKPEDTHAFELSYVNYWNAVTLTTSLYYRLTLDNIQQITIPLTPGNLDTTLTQFENIKSASNAGYELIARVAPVNYFDFTANVNIYYRHIDGDPALDLATTSGYSWNGNITANFKPVKKLGIQLRADYQSPQVIPQGKMQSIHGVDGGVRYDLTKQLTLSGNVRDIFNTRRYVSDINYSTPTFTTAQLSERRFATRTGIITLSYRFGNNGLPSKKKQRNTQPQDQDQEETTPQSATGGTPGGVTTGGAAPAGGGR